MSVFVTELKTAPKTKRWHWPTKAFLFSENRRELHDLAFELGLHAYTFINKPHFPCYPITVCKRIKAIEHGAIPQTDDECLEFIRKSTACAEVEVGN